MPPRSFRPEARLPPRMRVAGLDEPAPVATSGRSSPWPLRRLRFVVALIRHDFTQEGPGRLHRRDTGVHGGSRCSTTSSRLATSHPALSTSITSGAARRSARPGRPCHHRRSSAVAAAGLRGRRTWRLNPSRRSHFQPVSPRRATPQRSRSKAATFNPVHSPSSAGRPCNASNSAACCSSDSACRPPLVAAQRSVLTSGPSAFQRFGVVRTRAGVRPTWPATAAGAGGSGGRVSNRRAYPWAFSTPLRQERSRRATSSGSRCEAIGRRERVMVRPSMRQSTHEGWPCGQSRIRPAGATLYGALGCPGLPARGGVIVSP